MLAGTATREPAGLDWSRSGRGFQFSVVSPRLFHRLTVGLSVSVFQVEARQCLAEKVTLKAAS